MGRSDVERRERYIEATCQGYKLETLLEPARMHLEYQKEACGAVESAPSIELTFF